VLLSDRRTALIFGCLAVMESAWIAPFFLLFSGAALSPLAGLGLMLAGLLAWMLALDLLSRAEIESPLFEIIALGLMVGVGLALAWLWGRRGTAPGAAPGLLPLGWALFITNGFLWHRASTATSREVVFFTVARSFRAGLLLLILGGALYSSFRGRSPLPLMWVFLGAGLTAVALARIADKAASAQSAGAALSLRRLGQVVLAIGATLGAVALLSRWYTAASFGAGLRVFGPVWRLIEPVLVGFFTLLARLLDPVLRWLVDALSAGWAAVQGTSESLQLPEAPAPAQAPGREMPFWLTDVLPRVLLGVIILLAAVALIGFLLLWLERTRRASRAQQAEEEVTDGWEPDMSFLARGAESVRGLAGLVRRFGMSRQLLAAVSVENMYANTCRLARRRGFGRRPAQSPDHYLPTLKRAFDGHEDALARITAAYMRVHYGDLPVTPEELAEVRVDYQSVRQAPAG